ncbi:winged helix-turn-helix domain-containing protein [Desulfotalea psychrophila]|uniref:Related to molybdenum transport protein (ModE) n=1 Tax=Desulfotalea psychrophila (strain LSv54 / DSM 12343) TaxID=177439 RepID=Q6AIW2_DESPS|nr:winged helix-turn-helix domain-containing protein [Desulfotalea psychrophila]CAG37718.1 related to molybdenum transport protein (ModE) [Desulfotalea psychrophila LSv54]
MKLDNADSLSIKTKIWIENDQNDLHFGKGKTEILERIEVDGSIARAAENMGMNYKKAWTHIKTLQQNVSDELVISQKGRGSGGGTTLTPKAKELIRNYRLLQAEVEEFANKRFAELFLQK